MNEEPSFYVYEHWRPDTDVCFYVGKGSGKRAWKMSGRKNPHHTAIVSKLTSLGMCVDVRVVHQGLVEDDAFNFECLLIKQYGVENLTNMTFGGDGLRFPTPETRANMSKSQKKRFKENPDELVRMSEQRRGRLTSPETRIRLSKAGIGRSHSENAKKLISAARKAAGIPQHVRDAQRIAVTGKKRNPFSEETIAKMRVAAKKREESKRLKKEAA
jgi:hypothetical protein